MLLYDPKLPPVYRLRPTVGEDSYGDPVESWETPDRLRLKRAVVQRDSSTETETTARRLQADELVLVAPGAVDLTAEDRVEYLGETYKVQGRPAVREGLAQPVYTLAILTKTTG